MLKALLLPVLVTLFSTASQADVSTLAANCYRDVCVGDFVTSRSRSGAIIDGEVTRILGGGKLEVTWYWYNSWPYHVPNVRVSYKDVRKSQNQSY